MATRRISKSKGSRPPAGFQRFVEYAREQAKLDGAERARQELAESTAERDAVVASLAAFQPERRDAILEAARKLEVLADALVSHSECAERGEFDDVETVAGIVLSVARRQSNLASVIIRAFDPPERVLGNSTAELAREARNG